MGVIIQSENYVIGTVFDILLVFVLGSVLLFFGHSMRNENRFVMFYVSIFISVIMIYNLIYLHLNITEKEKENSNYNILVFLNIYLIILMFVLSIMSYLAHTTSSTSSSFRY